MLSTAKGNILSPSQHVAYRDGSNMTYCFNNMDAFIPAWMAFTHALWWHFLPSIHSIRTIFDRERCGDMELPATRDCIVKYRIVRGKEFSIMEYIGLKSILELEKMFRFLCPSMDWPLWSRSYGQHVSNFERTLKLKQYLHPLRTQSARIRSEKHTRVARSNPHTPLRFLGTCTTPTGPGNAPAKMGRSLVRQRSTASPMRPDPLAERTPTVA